MSSAVPKPDLLSVTATAGSPWQLLDPCDPPIAYASYYYCDELARLPVRAITKVKDNKSDPNLETGTYGLFSTCQAKMRSGIVRNRPRYIFFVTKPRKSPRQLTGMYELGWWAPGSLSNRIRDFALAATSIRFVTPEPLDGLPGGLAKLLSGSWRLDKRVGSDHAEQLARFLSSKPDRTGEYLLEIERMEQINRYHSTYRYPTWRRLEAFGWDDAERYLSPAPLQFDIDQKVRNSSPTGWWSCDACGQIYENKALLKACPGCRAIGSLRPLAAAPETKEAA